MKICNTPHYSLDPQESSNSLVIENSDSGATKNYWRLQDIHCLNNVKNTTSGPTVITPTTQMITATKQGYLPFAHLGLSKAALKTHVLKCLGSASLISLGQLYDNACTLL